MTDILDKLKRLGTRVIGDVIVERDLFDAAIAEIEQLREGLRHFTPEKLRHAMVGDRAKERRRTFLDAVKMADARRDEHEANNRGCSAEALSMFSDELRRAAEGVKDA